MYCIHLGSDYYSYIRMKIIICIRIAYSLIAHYCVKAKGWFLSTLGWWQRKRNLDILKLKWSPTVPFICISQLCTISYSTLVLLVLPSSLCLSG
jgi:hypothetical protein